VTLAEIVEKILWLQKHHHFGPAKIAMYLARYHDVTIWYPSRRIAATRQKRSQTQRGLRPDQRLRQGFDTVDATDVINNTITSDGHGLVTHDRVQLQRVY